MSEPLPSQCPYCGMGFFGDFHTGRPAFRLFKCKTKVVIETGKTLRSVECELVKRYESARDEIAKLKAMLGGLDTAASSPTAGELLERADDILGHAYIIMDGFQRALEWHNDFEKYKAQIAERSQLVSGPPGDEQTTNESKLI